MAEEQINVSFGPVPAQLASKVAELEAEGFPPDEAASLETMTYRLKNANSFFVGTYITTASSDDLDTSQDESYLAQRTLIGYVAGTCSSTERLEHENMFKHDPSGTHLCIHSVVTAPQYQRKGIARQAMLNYVKHIRESEKQIKRISLIAKASKTGLYESCGFRMLGISAVVHGADVWHELTLEL